MTTQRYAKAIDQVLNPAGFTRKGGVNWLREVGGYRDHINLQAAKFTPDRTVNVWIQDLATKELLERITAGITGGLMYSVEKTIGGLMPIHVKWWRRDDPEGPQQVADAIRLYALPFLDKMHSADAMMQYMHRFIDGRRWGDVNAKLNLAILLWRAGRAAEACELMQNPPKRIPDSWKAKIEAVGRFVCETPPPAPPTV